MKYCYFIVVLVAACLLESCVAPMSKQSYIEKYDKFIAEVSENYTTFSEKDWGKATAKYEKFTGEWYDKFKEDFTVKEKLALSGNQIKFNYYRTLHKSSEKIKQLIDTFNVDKVKREIKYYIDNNMQDDLKVLMDEAKKEGAEAEKAVDEILESLSVNVKELKDKYDI